jgi:sec-independent protein translocase protein TatB
MFDIGWSELLLIGIVALIVVGPKELPGLFRTAGRYMGRARAMAREFQRSMEQAADESGLKGATDDFRSINRDLSAANRSMRDYSRSILKNPPARPAPPKADEPAEPAGEPVKAGPEDGSAPT